MKDACAIVLARSGSKGVPGKNVAMIAGKPCIAWTILHARESRHVSRVVVSTDCAVAAAIAREYGAEVVQRPQELASDTARVDDAARHAWKFLAPREAVCVLLYANVPVRPVDLTDRAVGLLLSSGCDSVQSYQHCGKHHPWWTARVGEDGSVAPWQGEVLNAGVYRRQDLPPAFVPDGGVIALRPASLMLELAGVVDGPHAFFGKDRRGVISKSGSVIDIDERVDLLVADAMLRGRVESSTRELGRAS
jgi:N-acylneuraminate cytidylyltransferase